MSCRESDTAGTVEMTVAELHKLDLEDCTYWTYDRWSPAILERVSFMDQRQRSYHKNTHAYVQIGKEYSMIVAGHLFRPAGRTIGLPELDVILASQILVGWYQASVNTFARQPDWAEQIFEDLQRCYRGGQPWLM
jgi:hypothetical protein